MENKENGKIKNKIPFFKNVLMSIKDFDKYENFTHETMKQSFLYIAFLTVIVSAILAVITYKPTLDQYNDMIGKLKEKIHSVKYENDILEINNNEKIELEDNGIFVKTLIVDTSEIGENELEDYKNYIKENNVIVSLRDRLIMKSSDSDGIYEMKYSELKSNPTISAEFKKIFNSINNEDKTASFYLIFFADLIIESIERYIISILIHAILLTALCFITTIILKLNVGLKNSFKITTHALTLSVFLYLICDIIRTYTGFTLEYFEFMYYGVAYIYILTALFMIKSDNTKTKIALNKVKKIEEEIEEKITLKKEDQKRQKEKNDVKKRDRQKNKQQEDKTQGSNA